MARHITLTALLSFASLAASAAIPVRWSTDAYKVKPLAYECYHGETLDLAAALTAYGEALDFSGKTARLYWQTNGMDTAWWSTNAEVRVESGATNILAAVWSGAYDTGADSVTGFIGIDGENYRAAFTLSFLASPGFEPSAIPLPARQIDWAAVTNLNVESAPFALKGQGGGISASAVTGIVESAWVTNAGAYVAATNAAAARYLKSNGRGIGIEYEDNGEFDSLRFYGSESESSIMRIIPSGNSEGLLGNYVDLSWIRYTRGDLQSALDAKADANSVYTKSDITGNTVTNGGAKAYAEALIMEWEPFLDGSNVVFSITNYMSGSYSPDYAKLRILELTNGVYREVYSSHTDIEGHIALFRTNEFATATNAVITTVAAAIAGKADKAWGKYSSDGTELSTLGYSNTVYMTAPNTVFAGGLEYERVAVGEGCVCVLTTKGAPVWTQGDEGMFKFQSDGGTNYFGFAKTDSYTIGCDTDGISVSNNMVHLTYEVIMTGYPCIWYKSSLASSSAWEQLNLPDGTAISGASHGVSWTTSGGSKVAHINVTGEAQGFFRATIEVAGEAKFITNMPADLMSGIICTNGEDAVVAVRDGSAIYWQTKDGSATSRGASLSGYAADFNYGTNFTMRLYQALTNVIIRMGGSVTNAPAFN